MIPRHILPALCATALVSISGSLHAATIFGDTSDAELQENNTFGVTNGPIIRAGASSSAPGGGRNPMVVFQMPDFGAVANPFQAVDLGVYLGSLAGTPTYNVDVYGLGLQSSATLTIGTGVFASNRYYEGNAVDASVGTTLIQQDFVTQATSSLGFKNTNATGDAALLAYFNTLYASGAGANQFVILRLNPDVDLGAALSIGYNFASADNGPTFQTLAAGTTLDPVITYTVPEPGTVVTLLGSLALAGIIRRRR